MSLARFLAEGSWPMVPIYLCSLVALTVFLAKWWQLRAARLSDLTWLDGVLEPAAQGRIDEALARCCERSHPAASAVAAALAIVRRRPDRAGAEAARAGSLALQHCERHLGVLAFVARVAPLLGLLGTVIGMIDLFLDLERAPHHAVEVATLSSGMWTALLTTAAGLIVAVPALAGYTVLTARTDALRLAMHDAVERTLSALPAAGAAGAGDDGPP